MLTQEQLIACLENSLDPVERVRLEESLAADADAQRQLADQHRIDQALRVVIGNGAAHERVKQSILAVVQGRAVEKLKAEVIEETLAAQSAAEIPQPSILNTQPSTAWRGWGAIWSMKNVPTYGQVLIRQFTDSLLRPWNRVALGGTAAVIVLGLGSFLYFHGRPAERFEVGKFTLAMGTPKVQHSGKRSTLDAQRSTPVCLGDRIETGDADKAEIQFNDGTTLRLSFNTTLEIPKPTLQRSNASTLQRPPAVELLHGQIWSKVQKATNQAEFAVHTPVATAVVRGTEFGLKLQPLLATMNLQSAIRSPQSTVPLEAVLTVKEGNVQFYNSLGKVEVTPMTESIARMDAAPTEPKRLATLKTFRLTGRRILVTTTSRLDLPNAADRLVFPRGWAGLGVADVPAKNDGTSSVPKQVRLVRVKRDSAAEKAGLQVGDVVVAVDGQAIDKADQLITVISARPNENLALLVSRAGQAKTVALTTTSPPDAPPLPRLSRSAETRLHKATWLLIEAKTDEAERALRELLDTDRTGAAHNNLGVLYESKDELGKAIQFYQEAVRAEARIALYHFNLGMALKNIGNFVRAAEELETAARLASRWAGGSRLLKSSRCLTAGTMP